MTTTFNLTCQEIITEALELLTVIGPGMSINGEDYQSCLRSLNMMIKSWQSPPYGFHLWKIGHGTIFLTPGQTVYQIGGSSTDHIGDDAVIEEISANEAVGQTTLSVTDSSEMSASDIVGIELDDETLFWTTISSVPSATSIIVNNALTGAATAGNKVYAYTTASTRPLEISEVRCNTDETNDIRMYPMSKDQYYNLANKTNASTPIQYYVEPYKSYAKFYVYGTGSSVQEVIHFNYKKILEDMSSTTDLADFPPELSTCLAYNLAVRIAPKYDKEDKVSVGLLGMAKEMFDAMRDNDQESTNIKIVPNLWWY